MKRQNSWQDGIARIFKSYDSDKTTRESDTTDLKNETEFASERRDEDNDLDMAKAFQVCEGEEGANCTNRGTQASVLDNEAGSLWDLPDRQPAPGLTKPPGPSSPTPPADSFLKKLGSLFHFFSRTETRAPQLEQRSAVLPGPGGVTCRADRGQQASETTTGQPSEDGAGPQSPEMDEQPNEQEHSAYTAEDMATVAPSEHEGHTPDSQPSENEDRAAVWSPAADCLTPREATDAGQKQACEGPAVITHTTYRGKREVRKMRRRPPLQIYSPISEGEEGRLSRGSVSSEGAGSPCPVSLSENLPQCSQSAGGLSDDLPQHSQSAGVLPDVCSEHSELLTSQEDRSSRAADVQLTNAQGATCTRIAKEAPAGHQHCQETSVCVPDVRNCVENKHLLYINKSMDEQISDLPVGQVDCDQGVGESALVPDLSQDEEGLQCESKAMVDIILKNALTALEKIETSEQDNDIPHETDVDYEPYIYAEARHGYQNEDYDFKDAMQELEDRHVVPTHGDDQVSSGRAQGEGSRSTFSSGYESIAGSDTDIQCSPGQSFEGSFLALPTSGQQVEAPTTEMPGITDSCKEKVTGDTESENADCEKCNSESVDIIRNTTLEVEDGNQKDCVAFESKPKCVGTFEVDDLYSNSCLASDPEVEDDNEDIRPKPFQHSEQSVAVQPVSHYSIQSDPITSENDELVDCKGNVSTEVGNIDSETFSLTSKPEEKVQSQDAVRPKPLQTTKALETDGFKAKAGTEPTGGLVSREPLPEWSTVRANLCIISEDQDQNSEKYVRATAADVKESFTQFVAHDQDKNQVGPDQSASGISVLVSEPQRLLYSGFPIFSEEEEEIDAIFVNDTGPMERPAARRGKTYPFSLSPIFEEEESLQVPPATEEELKSTDQQPCSILSLLQSVSERLQSSAFTDSDHETDTDSVDALHCPRWAGLSDREEMDEEDHSIDQDLALPFNNSLKDEADILGSIEQTASKESHETPEEKDCVTTLSKPTRIARNPYYEYLKSKSTYLPQVENISDGNLSKAVVKGRHLSLKRIIPRPSVMYIYDGVTFSGEKQMIFGDVVDTGGMTFKTGVSIRVLTGCWLLYVEPGFKGSCVVLEEGEKVLTHGQEEVKEQSTDSPGHVVIGSIRRVVKDDSFPEIHCHGESESPIVLHSQIENLEAVQISDLAVKSGCWLAHELNGFGGNFAVLEARGRATHGPGSPLTHVRSLRPLMRGGPKVRRPLDPKMVVYELPHFQGQCRELGANMSRVEGLQRISSLRVISGIWVGYSREHYRGQQRLLEEGEYSDCQELGGSDQAFLSFRFLLADCVEPAISLRNAHSPETAHMDIVDLDVPDMEKGGADLAPASICVKSGVWVAYSGKFFSGDQYILEKGQHSGPLDWGDCSGEVMSIRPVRLSGGSREPKYLIRVYHEPHFSGEHQEFESEVADCTSLHPVSFRVIRGSWVLFDEEGCSGNQLVLTEGLYPNLTSCGNVELAIKSLKPVPYCFSEPSITLFSLDSFEGLETEAATTMDTMNGFFTQSVRVNSGLWVAYEFSNFKGRQMLLTTGDYSMWSEHSGWDTIGSLQPLGQPKAYVQLRNRLLGSVLTAEHTQDKDCPARVSLKPPMSSDCQQWTLTDGLLRCKVGKACMSVIGGKANAGARVALWAEHGRTHQRWSFNENGTISSRLNRSLVLDIRGGNGIDRDHFVVSPFSADQPTQYWDIDLA